MDYKREFNLTEGGIVAVMTLQESNKFNEWASSQKELKNVLLMKHTYDFMREHMDYYPLEDIEHALDCYLEAGLKVQAVFKKKLDEMGIYY